MSNSRLWPLRTGQSRAPWLWVCLLAGPWAGKLYFEQISNVAITFKLRAFTDNPALIAAVGSLNLVFSIIVGATCNYASDRVWTRWGRRKPFLIAGWSTIAVGCLILPQINTLLLPQQPDTTTKAGFSISSSTVSWPAVWRSGSPGRSTPAGCSNSA